MNKQIEEMAHLIAIPCSERIEYDGVCVDDKECGECHTCTEAAKAIYNAGYRKSTDVAREIFEEIDKELSEDEQEFERLDKLYQDEVHDYARIYVDDLRERFAELKKKYESEGADDEQT